MNTRTCSVIAVLTLMTFYSGCCRSGNFLSGRGARCGSPNSTPTPGYGNPAQGPYAQNVPCPPPNCGYETYVGNACGAEVYSSGSCGPCGNPGYAGVVTDPYMSGAIVGQPMIPYQGQVIQEGGVTIQPDDFRARKLDSDGSRILWESPLPQGATAL